MSANITEIETTQEEINQLLSALVKKEKRLQELLSERDTDAVDQNINHITSNTTARDLGNVLSNDDIARYSRQLILPDFGVAGQLKLKQTSFLIVGMGGLGCPSAQYLVAAGCGRIGLVDYDDVERSNFHRQTLHTELRVGLSKVNSAQIALMAINPHCKIEKHRLLLNSENASALIACYDVVLDCSDNVATRYLLNDACVLLHKPLVSGSALQFDGQLTVYHFGETGPCYRCLFPVPPPPETVTNCGDGGVLGAITGVIGSLQALEALKIALDLGDVLAGRLLIFDGLRNTFRNIKLRQRRIDCDVCSSNPLITRLIDYEQFCGMHASDRDHGLALLPPDQRINVEDYRAMQSQMHLLIDVRSSAEFEICRLPASINVPLKEVLDDSFVGRYTKELEDECKPVIVLCRRGNDSQIAVQHLRNKFPHHLIKDIVGGLHSWHYRIDNEFPIY